MCIIPPSNDNWGLVASKFADVIASLAQEGWILFYKSHKDLNPSTNFTYLFIFQRRSSLASTLLEMEKTNKLKST